VRGSQKNIRSKAQREEHREATQRGKLYTTESMEGAEKTTQKVKHKEWRAENIRFQQE
jgi:hypothetical protein